MTAVVVAACGSGLLPAQAVPSVGKPSAAIPAPSLPANQPATPYGDVRAPAAAEQTVSQTPAQRFNVEYSAGTIAVDATNASLSQVVREVARKASIKVTGNVADERIFGHYGPSAPSTVLAALLDGTSSNMLLVSDAKGSSELVLTPRRGTVTPPSPAASMAQQDNDADAPEESAPQAPDSARVFQAPVATGRGPVDANPDGSPAASPTPAASDEPSDEAPQGNGQRTPQQIYEQLQKMMQQRQSTNAPPTQPQDPQD